MATYRVEKPSNYTVLSNYHLDDKRLSLKAVGLLSYMLRLPDDWRFTIEWLARQHKDGVDSISTGLKELEGYGYIRRRQTHNQDGTFGDNECIVFERPPDAEDLPVSPFRDFPVTVKPFTVNPVTDNPVTENPGLPNTIVPSTVEPSTEGPNPPSPPAGGVREPRRRAPRGPKLQPVHKPERFARFWEAYPRHESKADAIRAWDKLAPSDELLVTMAKALAKQLKSEDWRRGIGVPYAATWLNKRKWEDVPFVPAAAVSPAGADGPGWYGEVGELWT